MSKSKVAIGTPSLFGETSIYYVNGIQQVARHNAFEGLIFRCGEPHQRARDGIVKEFLESPCEVLVFIDADIGFTWTDWCYLMEGSQDTAYARYLRKKPGAPVAVDFGLGFARIHRRVFEKLDNLTREDGAPLLHTMRCEGEQYVDYFPQGIDFEGRWRAEDHAFWALVAGAGCSVRMESRTRLIHTGVFHWPYDPAQLADPCKACGVGFSVCVTMGDSGRRCCENCDHDH